MAIEDNTMQRYPEKRSKPNLPSQQFPYLLPEIITEILSRLPVKSLLQFRSVSKSWRSLIDNPKFAKTHLEICSKNDEIAHHRLIFFSDHRGQSNIEGCHLSPVLNGYSVNPTELDYPRKLPYRYFWIVGSINGLICFSKNEHAFFWNPTTRILKKLPPSGVNLLHIHSLVYGFGYDESSDDYSLVELFRDTGGQRNHNVMVYSLRRDCWRRIGNFPSGENLHGCGKFVNGAIHWVAESTQNKGSNLPLSYSIVSLDLAKETYGEVAQPSYGEGEFDLTLHVLRECLFVLCDYRLSHADVWMMKEYGVRESWTKLACISYANDHSTFFAFPVLLHISKKGQILLQMGSRILVYDPKNNSMRNPDIHNLRVCHEANTYIESLVSPLSQEGQERHQ